MAMRRDLFRFLSGNASSLALLRWTLPGGLRRAPRFFRYALWLIGFGVVLVLALYAYLSTPVPAYPGSPQYRNGQFHNFSSKTSPGFWNNPRLIWTFLFDKPAGTVPDKPLPVTRLGRADLLAAPDNSVFRLGHSTLLFKLRGKFWLTDPMFAERASPFPWFGPKRFHPVPILPEDLPPLEAVILSHDHYDHLDRAAIEKLAGKTRYFVAPLGVGDLLVSWGVPAQKVRQLDWWESTEIELVRLVATPAQHFSGRSFWGKNKTLWTSWTILTPDVRLFFSGDSGYFDGFKAIGEAYGPFDMAFMETGAYNSHWPSIHMRPEETLQAFLDLRGKWLFPIHNGSFDLSLHTWTDPFEQISRLAHERGVALTTPPMGERVDLLSPQAGRAWWRE